MQHPGEMAPPGFQASEFCRPVLRAGAATAIDERADNLKSQFAQETLAYKGNWAVRWTRRPAVPRIPARLPVETLVIRLIQRHFRNEMTLE
jgi:hypothetical protein